MGAPPIVVFAVFLFGRGLICVGPMFTTFVIPSELFPTELRGSCAGIAAAMGKLGALIGVYMIPYSMTYCGFVFTFALCALAAAAGHVVTNGMLPQETLYSKLTAQQKGGVEPGGGGGGKDAKVGGGGGGGSGGDGSEAAESDQLLA